MSNTSEDLPDPDTPVTTISSPVGNFEVQVFEIVLARATNETMDWDMLTAWRLENAVGKTPGPEDGPDDSWRCGL